MIKNDLYFVIRFVCVFSIFQCCCSSHIYSQIRSIPIPGIPFIPNIKPGKDLQDDFENNTFAKGQYQFSQLYDNFKTSKTKSKFDPIVRIIEFEYDFSDVPGIEVRMTSGFNEGYFKGEMTILLDLYELTYYDSTVISKDYVESILTKEEVIERQTKSAHNPSKHTVVVTPEGTHEIHVDHGSTDITEEETPILIKTEHNKSQIYNQANFKLLPDDLDLIANSKEIEFSLLFQNATIWIKPSKKQVKQLRDILNRLDH